jgi:glutaminyl-peptide cyclotransferase
MSKTCCSLFLCILLTSCGSRDVEPPAFDGEQAFRYLFEQVQFGPRVPGTAASKACRSYFYEHFRAAGFQVDSQAFYFTDPYTGVDSPLVNVIAHYRVDEDDSMAVLYLAHYDSRPRAEHAFDSMMQELPIAGANDGASGVAVLMELANLVADRHPPVNVDLVLVDGEDWGKPGDRDHYLLGSRHFATGIQGKYHFGIVPDMVGDADQQIFREEFSERFHPELNDLVWNTAAELSISTFVDTTRWEVYDDHVRLNVGGVPSVVIVDFDYPYWHTEFDTPDKCSAQSLENVGRVLTKILYTPSSWPEIK